MVITHSLLHSFKVALPEFMNIVRLMKRIRQLGLFERVHRKVSGSLGKFCVLYAVKLQNSMRESLLVIDRRQSESISHYCRT